MSSENNAFFVKKRDKSIEKEHMVTFHTVHCCLLLKRPVAMKNRYTSRFTAASIWGILSLIVLLTRDPRRTSTHQLAEHEDCIKGEQKILLTN